MKQRNNNLNDALIHCKPARHNDKRQRHQLTEAYSQVKEYKRRLREEKLKDYLDEDEYLEG